MLAGSNPFYAPGSGVPCVYYNVTVDEEVINHHTNRDANGHVCLFISNMDLFISNIILIFPGFVRLSQPQHTPTQRYNEP